MTGDQWSNVPDPVIRNGTRLIDWCYDRGIRPPSLLEIEEERVRRGMRRSTLPGSTRTAGERRRDQEATR